MGKANKFELRFHHKEQLIKDTYTFYFEKPKGFNFIPGQYLKIYLEIENPDERGSSRYFTISSSPTDKDFITITTRVIKSSFKIKLASLNPGEKGIAFGPLGYFDFDPKTNKQNIFIAGGIGLTPYHSILKFIDYNKVKTNIILFAAYPFKENVIFYDELKEIEKRNSTIKVVYTLTKENKLYPGYEKGRVDENMIKKYVHNFLDSNFFIVGPPVMVESMFNMVIKLGISEKKIFKEDFSGY